MKEAIIPKEAIENKIYFIRGQKVMIDFDLASLYGVETRLINQAIRRNRIRFPDDFMFQLTKEEFTTLRSQIVISNVQRQKRSSRRGGRTYLPYALTEHGILMLSSVLNSKRAILINIAIMRAFVRLRQILSTHKELAQKLKELENRVGSHDEQIMAIIEAIRKLMAPPPKTTKKIGFKMDD